MRIERPGAGRRLPGVAALLLALTVMMGSAGPSGVAADSPAETAAPRETEDAAEVASVALTAEPSDETAEEAVSAWCGPVPEGEAVDDTYFDDVVFLGDSRTDGFRLYSGLTHGTYLCATGATVESVFSKEVETELGQMPLLDALAQTECGRIYVMLGVNELGWNGTQIFHDQYAKLIDRLREDHPDAAVVLESPLPVSAEQEAKGTYVSNERIAAYDQVIRQLAQEKDCPYLNVAEAVTDESGCLRADWNYDGVHLNPAGCRAWLDYLRTHPVM